jgi:hypothetical protein
LKCRKLSTVAMCTVRGGWKDPAELDAAEPVRLASGTRTPARGLSLQTQGRDIVNGDVQEHKPGTIAANVALHVGIELSPDCKCERKLLQRFEEVLEQLEHFDPANLWKARCNITTAVLSLTPRAIPPTHTKRRHGTCPVHVTSTCTCAPCALAWDSITCTSRVTRGRLPGELPPETTMPGRQYTGTYCDSHRRVSDFKGRLRPLQRCTHGAQECPQDITTPS